MSGICSGKERGEKAMFRILTTAIISTLVLTEIYCAAWLINYARTWAEERSEARREAFRVQAYRDVRMRSRMKQNRRELSKWIR